MSMTENMMATMKHQAEEIEALKSDLSCAQSELTAAKAEIESLRFDKKNMRMFFEVAAKALKIDPSCDPGKLDPMCTADTIREMEATIQIQKEALNSALAYMLFHGNSTLEIREQIKDALDHIPDVRKKV